MAGGTLQFLADGAWTKRLHPGWAAASGLTAAALAAGGFKGPRHPYEGRYGLYATHMKGAPVPDLDPILAGLGDSWEVLNMAIKPLPACHFTHAASDAARALSEKLPGAAAQIREVIVRVSPEVIPVICEPADQKRRPRTAYEAQFSLPYIVAVTLKYGEFGLEHLDPDALNAPETLELADKVRYEADSQSSYPRYFSGEVEVRLADGRSMLQRVEHHRGSDLNPLSTKDVMDKFHATAGRAVSAEFREALAKMVDQLECEEKLTDFFDLLSAGQFCSNHR